MGVTLQFEDESCLPAQLQHVSLEVDVGKVSQVIRNLVNNAIKFTPVGGKVIVTSRFLENPISEDVKCNLVSLCNSHCPADQFGAEPVCVTTISPSVSNTNKNQEISKLGKLRFAVIDTGCGLSEVS